MTAPVATDSPAPDAAQLLAADARKPRPFIAPRLLRFCAARLGGKQGADDVAQEALVNTLTGEGWHRWTYDGKGTPEESLLTHLVNQAKDVIKKDRERASNWREVHVSSGGAGEEPDSEAPSGIPGDRTPSSEKRMTDEKRVETILKDLDPDARSVLDVEAQSEEELAPKDIADKLGWTVGQVHRARERVFYRRDVMLAQEAKRAASKRGGPS